MDEMSNLYLQMNDMKLHKEIMQESDNLELEIQQTIDSAQKMLVASPQVLEKDNPVDTESVLLTGGNDLSTESNNNLQTEVQTPSHQDPTPSSQAPIPPGTQTTTLPYQSPSSQAPIPPGTQTTTLPYQSPSYHPPIPPGTQSRSPSMPVRRLRVGIALEKSNWFTLDFQREFYACSAIVAKYKQCI
jgi:hypothetical protein